MATSTSSAASGDRTPIVIDDGADDATGRPSPDPPQPPPSSGRTPTPSLRHNDSPEPHDSEHEHITNGDAVSSVSRANSEYPDDIEEVNRELQTTSSAKPLSSAAASPSTGASDGAINGTNDGGAVLTANGAAVTVSKDEASGSDGPKPKPKSKASAKPASTAHPNKVKKARSPSPSPPPPPPPPPPLKTVRLEIRLGGPDNYAVDISSLAKRTGQRPPTPPPPVKRDTSDSEGDDEGDGKGKTKGKGKGGRKKNAGSEYYDLNDPFIDDSDLAIDERTYFAQTKQQGFYVSSGEVALLKDKSVSSAKKPKSKKVALIPTIIPLAGSHSVNSNISTSSTIPISSPSVTKTKEGSRDSPIALLSEGEGDDKPHVASLKRKGSVDSISQAGSTKKKRRTVEIESFHPDLQKELQDLKVAIANESFEQKGKFPPSLKPVLAKVALKAIVCGEYNDTFFSLMPKLFIYNKFTMTKLIKRTVYPEHQVLLMQRQDQLLVQLKQHADEGFPKAQEEWEKSVAASLKRQEKEKAKTDQVTGSVASAEGTPVPTATPLPAAKLNGAGDDADSGMDNVDKDGQGGAKDKDTDKEGHQVAKKYRLTERMKAIIWELVVLSNESCRIENEKNTFENSTVQVSEQGTRKVLYQKIVAAFPDGWMSSGQISREVSVMKKRFEAQQQEE